MISFMISVVAPKFHEIRGLPSGTGFQESSWIRRGLFPGGCAQDVAGEIAGGPARSGARPRTAFAVSIATATWLAIAPLPGRRGRGSVPGWAECSTSISSTLATPSTMAWCNLRNTTVPFGTPRPPR
jgi:hypothetical protein